MIKIYHNPRCSKSREGLCALEDKGMDVEVINYIKNPLTVEELKELIALLKITPIELIRTKEAVWKEQFKDRELTDEQLIEALATHPQLIERPIVVNGTKAIIARPTEKIAEIL